LESYDVILERKRPRPTKWFKCILCQWRIRSAFWNNGSLKKYW
jgi:hypothetical protein